jgi:hypothetical protein
VDFRVTVLVKDVDNDFIQEWLLENGHRYGVDPNHAYFPIRCGAIERGREVKTVVEIVSKEPESK